MDIKAPNTPLYIRHDDVSKNLNRSRYPYPLVFMSMFSSMIFLSTGTNFRIVAKSTTPFWKAIALKTLITATM